MHMTSNKNISLVGIIGIGLTTVIGSGIWKDSLLWSSSASIFSLLAVFLAWLLMFCAGLAYAESVGMFPQGGGPYSYVGGAFGRKAGSFVGILYLISYYMIGAILSFLTALFSLAAIDFTLLTGLNLTIVTIIVVILFTIISNLTSYKILGLTTFVWSVLKIVLVIGVFAFLFLSWTPTTIAIPDLAGFQSAVNSSIWALLGFEVMLVFAGETNEAEKTIPRAITIVLPFFLIIYLLVSFLASGIIGLGDIAAGTGSVSLLMLLASSTGIPASYIFAFGAFSAAGTAYLIYAMCTKQMRILASDNVLPKALAGKRSGVDMSVLMTIIFGGIVAGVMVGTNEIWADSVDVFASVGIGLVLMSAMLPAGLTALVLRRRMPALDRPFKTPLYQVVFPLAILLSIYLIVLNFLNPAWFLPSMTILAIAFIVTLIIVLVKGKNQ
ncbi:MAG: APC family permease [Candidatus Thorarchaeota archaeon]|nr:MAG: APC family permease [Candidatus Thorarchaeota archaeon]